MEVYDLCIIGAGMFGSAAARHASVDPSIRVCLIGPKEPTVKERQDREIYSCHYDEGRIVSFPSSLHAYNALSKVSIDRLCDLETLSGKRFYTPLGVLLVQERNERLHDKLEALQSSGIPVSDLSKDCSYKNKFPYLKVDERDFIGLGNSKGGHISARTYVEAQKQVAQMQGCDLIEDVVEDVIDLKEGIHMIVTETKTVVRSQRVLFCTGAFTQFKKFYSLLRLKITIHKETVALLQISRNEAEKLRSMPPMNYNKRTADMPLGVHGAYILPPIQYPDGEFYLKIGPNGFISHPEIETLQEVKEWYNSRGSEELLNILPKLLKELIPNLKVERERSATCLTCGSPSGLPYIDKISSTITVAVAGNGSGASISDEVGRLAAHLSLTGKWDSELPKSLFQAILKNE